MTKRPENFDAAGRDPEATLTTPRFDAEDARRAHPVVPLAQARPTPRSSYGRARRPRRSWTPALLAVALLAVAAVAGAVATNVMRSPSAEQTQDETLSAPAQTAEAAEATEAPPQPVKPPAAEAPRRDAPAAKPSTREARTRRATAATYPALEDDYEDEERRGRRAEKRRERDDDDEVEKEMRKALKRAKGKAPRLVDVLTTSRQ